MLKRIPVAVLGAVIAAFAEVDYPSPPPEQNMDAHDPAVFKDGRTYYIYGTHNMPVWESRDLVHFELVERKLIETAPAEARAHVGEQCNDMWAPDIVKAGKEYRLYYCFENHSGWLGPGHNSVLHDGDNWFLVHHARVEAGGHKQVHTHVRKMVFTDEGWPVVSPERYAGEKEQPIPEKEMFGEWEILFLDPNDSGMQRARTGLVFGTDGSLRFGDETGKWEVGPPNSLRLMLGQRAPVSAKILTAWDWENDRPALVFTGLDKDGVAAWGKRRDR